MKNVNSFENAKFYLTKKRDGQSARRVEALYGCDSIEEAIKEFSERFIKYEISEDYTWIESEEDYNIYADGQCDAKWHGAGYYAVGIITFGREDFYSPKAQFDSYYKDVTAWGIEEISEEELQKEIYNLPRAVNC